MGAFRFQPELMFAGRKQNQDQQEVPPEKTRRGGVATRKSSNVPAHGTNAAVSCSWLWLCRIPGIVEQVRARKTAPRDSPRTSLKREQSCLHFGGKTTPCTVPFKRQTPGVFFFFFFWSLHIRVFRGIRAEASLPRTATHSHARLTD